jgi:hypothetical protein
LSLSRTSLAASSTAMRSSGRACCRGLVRFNYL